MISCLLLFSISNGHSLAVQERCDLLAMLHHQGLFIISNQLIILLLIVHLVNRPMVIIDDICSNLLMIGYSLRAFDKFLLLGTANR